jgi:hypothetical protein
MRLATLLLALLLASPLSAQVTVYPPEASPGQGLTPADFPILAPCGAIGAPSYSFNGAGNGEMGMWCTATDPSGTLVIQNRYDNAGATAPNLEGRSRLSLGLEFWSLNAVRVEDDDYMSIQGFDEGGGVPKVRIDVTDDAVTGSYSFFEDRFESTERIFGQVQSACTINALSYSFLGDTDTGVCSDGADEVEIFAGAGMKIRASDTQVVLRETGAGSNNSEVQVQGFFPSLTVSIFDDVADLSLALQLLGAQDEGPEELLGRGLRRRGAHHGRGEVGLAAGLRQHHLDDRDPRRGRDPPLGGRHSRREQDDVHRHRSDGAANHHLQGRDRHGRLSDGHHRRLSADDEG